MTEHAGALAHQFDDLEQQYYASTLGMWLFLATEILFFGGMFLGYAVYRGSYPDAFAEASRHMDVVLGSINTAVLLCSSLTMALAVHAAQLGARRGIVLFLVATMVLGGVFLGIKFVEYYHKYEEGLPPAPHERLFFVFYFVMTGMHALHMVIGIGLLAVFVMLARAGRFSAEYHWPVEIMGLYWHFVDIVWIFLFPLLYLVH